MSDHRISIVPRKSTYPGNKVKAKEIHDWLVATDVVKSTLSDCILSSDYGYTLSEGAKRVVEFPDDLPFNFALNGLEIVTERQIFHTGENGMEQCICPACKKDIASEDWDFLNDWAEQKSNNLTCPLCNIANEIHQFRFSPEWGFSDLGFTFWNWPNFTEKFIAEFRQKLACDISMVYAHL